MLKFFIKYLEYCGSDFFCFVIDKRCYLIKIECYKCFLCFCLEECDYFWNCCLDEFYIFCVLIIVFVNYFVEKNGV